MKTLNTTNLLNEFATTLANSNPTQPATTTQGCTCTTTIHNTPTYDEDFDDFDNNFITLQNALIQELNKQGLETSITNIAGLLDQVLITARDNHNGDIYAHIILTHWDGELALTITQFYL